MNELFTIPESQPPLIVTLRKAHDDAMIALVKAEEAEDDYGTPVPLHVRKEVDHTFAALCREEARLASEGKR